MREIYIDIETGSIKTMRAIEQDNADKAYRLIVIENEERFDLTNKTVRFAFKRFGDTAGDIIDLPIINAAKGEIEFKIDKRITKEDGVYICQLAIYGADNYLKHTGNFKLLIDENLFNSISNELMSDEEFKKLNSMINQGNELKNNLPGLIDNMNNIKSELDSNITKLNDTYKKIQDTKDIIDKANSLKTELEQGMGGVDSKNAELQKNLKEVEQYISTLKYSTNLPKMRSDIDKNASDISKINENIGNISKVDLSNYYNKKEVDDKISHIDISNVDLSNYYKKSETYNRKEIDDKISAIESSGGGGGISNNTAPVLTTTLDKSIFTVDEDVIIPFFIIDGQGGSMELHKSLNGVDETLEMVKIGQQSWNLGKLKRGTYKVIIYVKDVGGLFSNQLVFDFKVGALEISSKFNDSLDYSLGEEIVIGYTIESMGKQKVNLKTTIDGVESSKEVNVGFNNLILNTLTKGVHTVTLQAYYDNIVSNTISFNLVVTDSNTLFLSTNFDGKGLTNADYISIPYRISLQGQKRFIVHASINDVDKPIIEGILGTNQLQLGYLEPGLYTIKIYATTIDKSQTSNTLTIQLNIVQSDFNLVSYTKDSLLLDLNSDGKSNFSTDKKEWIDKSPYNTKVTMNHFNYIGNGWIDNSLVINGTAFCEFDIQPFKDNCPKGLTVDFYFKYKESSEENIKFVDCIGKGLGFFVDDEYVHLCSSEGDIKYPLIDGEYVHIAYVIDWNTQFEYIYVNGCISAAQVITKNSTNFINNSTIKIGACTQNTAVECAFKNFRIYNRALEHTEILNNFISNKDMLEQKEILKRNSGKAMPEMNIQGNFDGMGKDLPVKLKIDFRSKGLAGNDFSLPNCNVEWQGDSTLQYAVKNYSIKLYQESGDKYNVQPKETWPKTNRVWTKANMMDSSSATSTGIGHMFAALYKEKTPPMMDKRSSLYTVDSFPILMYHNDKFAGIYTWMLPPKANPLGLDYNKPLNYNFGCEENAGNGIGAFNLKDSIGADKIPTKEDILNGWSCYRDTDGNAFSHFAALLKWVNDCYWSGTNNYTKFPAFREKAAKKFNLPFLIDYYIYCYVFGLVDSLGKNLQLYSFGTMNDEGEPIWYTTFFDFDTGLGCDNKGEFVWPPDIRCPEDYNTPHNLLWEMVRNEFKEEIKARYIEMRRSNLTNKKFKEIFYDDLIHTIGEKYYNMDALNKYFVWGSGYIQMFHGNKWLELKKWFKERLIFADTVFGYTGDLKHTVILRNVHDGQLELNLKTESPQYVTVSFGGADGASDGNVITKKCNEDEFSTYRYSYNGSYQKDLFISSASQITDLKGLAASDLVMLDVQYATRLRDINIDNNPKLTAANFSNCENLESFSAKNCTSLNSVLDFNKCLNLKAIDISNSSVKGLVFNNCVNLQSLNISNASLKSLYLDDTFTNLTDLNLVGSNVNNITFKNIDVPNLATLFANMDSANNNYITLDNITNFGDIHIKNKNTGKTSLTIKDCPSISSLYLDSEATNDITLINNPLFTEFKFPINSNTKLGNITVIGDKTIILDNDTINSPELFTNITSNVTIYYNCYFPQDYSKAILGKKTIYNEANIISADVIYPSETITFNNCYFQDNKLKLYVYDTQKKCRPCITYIDNFKNDTLFVDMYRSDNSDIYFRNLKNKTITIDSDSYGCEHYTFNYHFENCENVTIKNDYHRPIFTNCKNVTLCDYYGNNPEIINN